MANIAEGFGRRSDKGFANFLNMAHGSGSEVQSHLYVALDLNYISKPSFADLNGLLDEVSRMSLVLAQHLRKFKIVRISLLQTAQTSHSRLETEAS
jgi:four helix bundle protein